eukprot:g32160.t1
MLMSLCKDNNLFLNVTKTKQLIIDFRKKGGGHIPTYINRAKMKRVESIKSLGVMITNNLSRTTHIDVTDKKAQQCIFFFRRLRKFSMSIRTLTSFYRCTIESILSGCIMACYGICSGSVLGLPFFVIFINDLDEDLE